MGQDAASKFAAVINTGRWRQSTNRMTLNTIRRVSILLLTILTNQLFGQPTNDTVANKVLFGQIMMADSIFFQSLNNCDLRTYELFLTDDFEFYHDKGGLTKTREAEMKSMASFCGEQRQKQKLKRELIHESVEVSPIKNFGAVETGRHRFYLVIDEKIKKVIEEAKFTNLWEKQPIGWKLSRVISYDHQSSSVIQLAEKELELFVGKYQMSPDKIIVVKRVAKLLNARNGDWSADLYPETNSIFYLDYGNVQFKFVKGQTGQVEKIIIYENGKQIEQGTRSN